MKIKRILTALLILPGAISLCAQTTASVENKPITIRWYNEKQEIEGFGVSQAGWAQKLYNHYQREEVMGLMFGQNGLRLNMLRGEIFPSYWPKEGDTSFDLDADINVPLTDPFMAVETDDLKQRGQLWVTKMAKEKYKVDKLMFSAWSPPAYMKSNQAVSNGYLKRKYHQAYADFLAAFYKAYKSVGLEPYAISPSNEPGYAAPWNSSLWTADKMGTFIIENLGPTFKKEGIPAKIVFGENPFWSVNNQLLAAVSSLDFTQTIIQEYPEIKEFNTVASGHGYTITEEFGPLYNVINTPIVPYTVAEENNIPVWMTEISTTDPLDITMENGLDWAENFHQYLTVANVSTYLWWAGALPAGNNEGLITLNGDRDGYTVAKRFDTFGNFTRYIPSGSRRVEVESPEGGLLVSAFKNGKDFTMVFINKTTEVLNTTVAIDGASITGTINAYLTDETNRWAESTITNATMNNQYLVNVPAKSVLTLTGRVK